MVSSNIQQFSVLLIENSDYDPKDVRGEMFLTPMKCATNDRSKINKLLDSTNVDTINNEPIYSINKNKKKFD